MKERDIILDIYVFDADGNILAVNRGADDMYLPNVVSMILLTLPIGEHPVKYIKDYLKKINLEADNVELLPSIFLNKFDTEMHKDYLVLSFKVIVEEKARMAIRPFHTNDKENLNLIWLSMDEFLKHPKLMPEFKKNNFNKILNGQSLFYKGTYKESDSSSDVINFEEY